MEHYPEMGVFKLAAEEAELLSLPSDKLTYPDESLISLRTNIIARIRVINDFNNSDFNSKPENAMFAGTVSECGRLMIFAFMETEKAMNFAVVQNAEMIVQEASK